MRVDLVGAVAEVEAALDAVHERDRPSLSARVELAMVVTTGSLRRGLADLGLDLLEVLEQAAK